MRTIFLIMVWSWSFSGYAAPGVGDNPFDFVGKDLKGKEIHVSDFKGKVVVVTFWATWCSYCLKELPVLEGIQKKVGSDKLQVVAANKSKVYVGYSETMLPSIIDELNALLKFYVYPE